MRADFDRFLARRVARNRVDAAPVLADLGLIGFHVQSVGELYGRKHDYERAIPTLLYWLPRVSNEDVKEDIVRALSVKWAKPAAAPLLVAEFANAKRPQLKWAIGSAIEVTADDSMFEEIRRLVTNPEHGRARQMLVEALGRMKDPRAFDVAATFLDQPEFAGYAAAALGRLKDPRALPLLEKLSSDSESWIRREAQKAIRKVERANITK